MTTPLCETSLKEIGNIKAVIFDCDGTLVNSEVVHYEAWRYALLNQDFDLTKERYIRDFIGNCDILLSKMSIGLLGFDCSETLLKEKNEFFLSNLRNASPIEPTLKFLKHLIQEKPRLGIKLAVASGARKDEILHNLSNLRIENSFDVILSGVNDLEEYQDLEGTNKPKPYVYEKAARMLGVEPCQCIAIEDSRAGISAAVAAGCIAIAVPNQFTQHQDLSQAHLNIQSLDVLSFNDLLNALLKASL